MIWSGDPANGQRNHFPLTSPPDPPGGSFLSASNLVRFLTRSSCPALSRVSTSIRPTFCRQKGVDGRVKHGHDDLGRVV
jgi:hypothetical protein